MYRFRSSNWFAKPVKMPYRSQKGLEAAAEELHLRFNKQLQCPTCFFQSGTSGAFNKDSGGQRGKKGQYYRRFRCRSQPRCGKTLGVNELVKLCHQIDPTGVDGILKRFTDSPTGKHTIYLNN